MLSSYTKISAGSKAWVHILFRIYFKIERRVVHALTGQSAFEVWLFPRFGNGCKQTLTLEVSFFP